ncbi:MAG: NADH:ubiquinone oxidoreductase subunit NDUFA12 [Alphaproteobacteria bacterium]|nr:NADH:ubiquinone oxidoreductase subunit NDUFA12 [Alphaproteobacteria bacterium]MBF0129570.1 NADH:ubiquinone oxidoreductase subunit NDUFA12 [Alphaproteobacteria bacterium]
MILGTLLFTWFKGKPVGTDQFGNRYFRASPRFPGGRERRWVLYKGSHEASKVPPEWHSWLHHTTAAPLERPDRPWVKEHLPNLSGTAGGYVPPGHDSRGGARPRTRDDYQPWQPE